MRSEFKEYYLNHTKKVNLFNQYFVMPITLKIYKKKFKQLPLGSEEWHKEQQKIALLSSTTFDCKIRSLFYEITMRENCKGMFYCLPGTTLCFPNRIKLGYNLFLNRNVYIVARDEINIGDNVIIGPNTIINSGSHLYSDPSKLIRDQGHKKAPINIGDDVFIGANVVILPGVTIGKGAVVGAGSVVSKSIEPYSVAVGSPATIIKRRLL